MKTKELYQDVNNLYGFNFDDPDDIGLIDDDNQDVLSSSIFNDEYNKNDYETYKEQLDFDDELDEEDVCCSQYINNIFPLSDNIHDKGKKIVLKQPIYGFKELSLSFSLLNINRILHVKNISFKDVLSDLEKHGKRKPNIKNKEVERIVNSYIQSVPHSNDDIVVATYFINMWKEGLINKVISYYFIKANSRSKRNTSTVGVNNIMCSINADRLRELCFNVTQDNKKFNPLDNRELYMIEDNARIFWNLYMLLIFYKVCGVIKEVEEKFFNYFFNIINLVLVAGMRTFVQFELSCSYGEIYQELQGFKPINEKYMSVDNNHEHQQIYFRIKNSDFLTEAYKNDYSGAIYIPEYVKDIKKDKHIDIQLWIKKGTSNNSLWIEVLFSGQHPIGRIYDCETDPETVINFINIFNYCPEALRPVMYLFKQVLNYSKDFGITSYYTEIQKYLKQFKGKRTRGIVPKVLNVIIRILHDRPDKAEFNKILEKYFKDSDTKQISELKKIYNELQPLLKQKKVRAIEKLRKELEDYVW
ncbi:hypothetical protein J6R97_00165 [bacterium]|nr:hypothetical protein [bacterium]